MAITDASLLMPPAFEDGLTVWSSQDGTPGSATYDGATNAAIVPADQDFGSCLELLKTTATQKLRYMGETPLVAGCYLKISARVKAISGNLPSVRIAGWAGAAGGGHVGGLVEVGASTTLTAYGDIVTVEAIVGAGGRTGVSMIWGTDPVYGHFGLDLTGPNGGVVRIDDFVIEDVTSDYVREMLDIVDVKDFGAVGDGVTDDLDAFNAADAAANGRTVLVPEGVFRVASHMTFDSHVRFHGTLNMNPEHRLMCLRDFELNTYIDAFGNEVDGFKKAFQALLQFNDHDSLDMNGRKVDLSAPLDMQAIVDNRTSFATRRVIRNGTFAALTSTAWDTGVVTSSASYATSAARTLSNVTNVANIEVGSLVEGTGVGREVYVRDKDVAAQTITLSADLYDAQGTQVFTFRRFRYLMDFSGFSSLSAFNFENCDWLCSGRASAIMLAKEGLIFHLKSCFVTRPKDRGITSIGRGCQGMLLDQCNFASDETSMKAQDRVSIGLNTNANDLKIRDCRAMAFRHFAVIGGSGNVLVGNHWFQGDSEPDGVRLAGIVMTKTNVKTLITGNYIDNASIEWGNEQDAFPDQLNEFSFGGLTITGNHFTTIDAANWFRFLVVKPYGTNHFIDGLYMSGNVFKCISGNIGRIEGVDTSIADLKKNTMRNITITGNTFNGVDVKTQNPATISHTQSSKASNWLVDFSTYLPFDGWARFIDSFVLHNAVTNTGGGNVYHTPYFSTQQGADQKSIRVNWPENVSGKVFVTARIDNPA